MDSCNMYFILLSRLGLMFSQQYYPYYPIPHEMSETLHPPKLPWNLKMIVFHSMKFESIFQVS